MMVFIFIGVKEIEVPMDKTALFVISHAGASATLYRKYQNVLGQDIDVCILERPGIGLRLNEQLLSDLKKSIHDLIQGIEAIRKQYTSFAIYGHSLGGMLAYEIGYHYEGYSEFRNIFISAFCAPSDHHKNLKISQLDDMSFIKAICDISNLDITAFEHDVFKNVFMPILRSDFKLFDSYSYLEQQSLSVNATILYGENDSFVDTACINNWDLHFKNTPKYICIPGDHMFHINQFSQVASYIRQILAR